MNNHTLEIAAPSPTNTTSFSLSVPDGANITIAVRSNNIFFDCFWQGAANPNMVTRNYLYQSMPYNWDDEAPATPYTFIDFVPVPSGTYLLLYKYK